VGFAVGGSAFLLTEVMLLQLGSCSVVVADNCDARFCYFWLQYVLVLCAVPSWVWCRVMSDAGCVLHVWPWLCVNVLSVVPQFC
jgi:hypothetical protein